MCCLPHVARLRAGRGGQCILCWDRHLAIAGTEGGGQVLEGLKSHNAAGQMSISSQPPKPVLPSAPQTPLPRLLGLAIR